MLIPLTSLTVVLCCCNPSVRRSGDWEHAQRHGRGKLELSNGFVYDGGWVRNVMEGMMILGVAYDGVAPVATVGV
jgi:hypothetical protein